ncbi:MAG: glycosyltransferase family 4 protein [Saprospiraceae bacterium]|nr:glycosyltransferase family 4 protein [Saprospiraceae bacterium]MCF8250825.1 glycosyltransferase family 4 protein [Saprospiraceae bacterium]MCF8281440.1 glycosyltransferase family 4 protein [Bacteroidales bacterium]MCF8312626.1 glycosyltransferase family 4 protein [Saprospiraceae bacterium]MCF8441016.1 glycosyltransferase family 4 protein [Saprospiraceae bacterium]
MTKIKIAIFGANYFPSKGGTSRVVENLLRELHSHFEFTVYCFEHPGANTYITGVSTVQFPEIRIKGLGVFLFYLRCCAHLMLKGGYDLVHLHKTDGAFFLPLLNLKFRTIATSHALPQLDDKWSWLGKFYFQISERLFIKSSGVLTTISSGNAEYYLEKYQRRVAHIPNGIFPAGEVPEELSERLLSKHELRPGYLLFAARRVIPLKGCHTLLEALKLLEFKGTLVVAGDMGHLASYTQKLHAAARGLDVRFIGYVDGLDKLTALLSRASLFVFPSEIEAMSMMLLETATAGTPMVCSDIPQNTAVLSEQEVLFFQSKNAPDLAEKLRWAINQPVKMAALARQAKQRVEREYLISAVAHRYTDLYQAVARNNHRQNEIAQP